jgi:hypothetical protein
LLVVLFQRGLSRARAKGGAAAAPDATWLRRTQRVADRDQRIAGQEYRVSGRQQASVESTSRAVEALSAELIRGMIPKEQSTSRPKGSNMNERLLEQLGDHFIGLWRFRIYGVRRLWCVTLHVNGYYFDTRGKPTISEALKAAIKVVQKAKKKTTKFIR